MDIAFNCTNHLDSARPHHIAPYLPCASIGFIFRGMGQAHSLSSAVFFGVCVLKLSRFPRQRLRQAEIISSGLAPLALHRQGRRCHRCNHQGLMLYSRYCSKLSMVNGKIPPVGLIACFPLVVKSSPTAVGTRPFVSVRCKTAPATASTRRLRVFASPTLFSF